MPVFSLCSYFILFFCPTNVSEIQFDGFRSALHGECWHIKWFQPERNEAAAFLVQPPFIRLMSHHQVPSNASLYLSLLTGVFFVCMCMIGVPLPISSPLHSHYYSFVLKGIIFAPLASSVHTIPAFYDSENSDIWKCCWPHFSVKTQSWYLLSWFGLNIFINIPDLSCFSPLLFFLHSIFFFLNGQGTYIFSNYTICGWSSERWAKRLVRMFWP